MKTLHVIYCITIFLLIVYIGTQQTSFSSSLEKQEEIIDSLSVRIGYFKNYSWGIMCSYG